MSMAENESRTLWDVYIKSKEQEKRELQPRRGTEEVRKRVDRRMKGVAQEHNRKAVQSEIAVQDWIIYE
jgi:hypothetical protein